MSNPSLTQVLHPNYPYIKAEVIYSVRHEMAITPRDILARRFRLELLDWQTCKEITPSVCELMAVELNWNDDVKRKAILNYQVLLSEFSQAAKGKLLDSQ